MIRNTLGSWLGHRMRGVALLSIGVVSLLLACGSTKAKADSVCSPGNVVFCRCQDRQEGQKECKDDGQSFGPCEPCESEYNPEGPLEPGDPGPDEPLPEGDGGTKVDSSVQGCGDGVVQAGEDCDDANTDPEDGCDSQCKLSGLTPPKSNACPGLDVHVWGGTHKPSLVTDTHGSGERSATPLCPDPNSTSGATAPDRIFKVFAHKTGSMTVATSSADYNSFLYVSTGCDPDKNTWIKCINANAQPAGESLTFPVESGKTYYVFVDGAGPTGNAGTARVTFSIP